MCISMNFHDFMKEYDVKVSISILSLVYFHSISCVNCLMQEGLVEIREDYVEDIPLESKTEAGKYCFS